MKIGIVNLGCPKNIVDTECMLATLGEFSVTISPRDADAIIINTCGFLKAAREEAEKNIEEMLAYIKFNKALKVIVAGCYVTKDKQKLIEKYPQVYAWVGVNDIKNMKKALEGGGVYINSYPYIATYRERSVVLNTYSAYVKISDGCNHRCAFCLIPSIKGAYRSRTLADIVKETLVLTNSGIKEICFISQDTTHYGRDIYKTAKIGPLLSAVMGKIKKKFWLRIMYLYPELSVIKDIVAQMKKDSRICRYFDIPFQHVSDKILKSMKRGYGKKEIFEIIKYIKENLPDAEIRSSFITGYPGESEKEFKELLEFIKEGYVDKAGFFAYSDEREAASYALTGKVNKKTAENRRKLLALAYEKFCESNNKKHIGKIKEVLITGREKKGFLKGRTAQNAPDIDTYVLVKTGKKTLSEGFCKVRITKSEKFDLIGELAWK
ncbi:MAG: 30S ribosomal protein S12 methylthiotransferase RimO [bacterium]